MELTFLTTLKQSVSELFHSRGTSSEFSSVSVLNERSTCGTVMLHEVEVKKVQDFKWARATECVEKRRRSVCMGGMGGEMCVMCDV